MSTASSTKKHDLLDTSGSRSTLNDINLTEQAPVLDSQLKRHSPAIYLIILYIPLVVVPWMVTVVLSYRPISKRTYYYPEGFDIDEYKRMQSWVTAISVLNSIASLLAVPVVSFVIAQSAVVFSQKRVPTHQLSVRDIFAFADRAWTDISVLYKLIQAKGNGSRAFNTFISLAAGFLLISTLQPPLYQILVDWKSITIPSGILERTKITSSLTELRDDKIFLGEDAEPATMEMIPHATVLKYVQYELPSVKRSPPEMYMWIDYNGTQPPVAKLENPQGDAINNLLNVRFRKSPSYQQILPAFFAAFPFNVTTGTKRHHAIRFNSTIECEVWPKEKFPLDCSGSKPYSTSIKVKNDTSSSELRICVPGAWGTSPWTLSRNRQDIEEEVYLQMSGDLAKDNSSTIHCSSGTTRGYFELGNYRSNLEYGPLLERWPSPDILKNDFNDKGISCTSGDAYSCNTPRTYIPSEWDTMIDRARGWTSDEPEYMRWNASSPLVTSVMSLFGDDSWIRTAVNLSSIQGNSSTENTAVPHWWKPFCERQPEFHSNMTQCDYDIKPSEAVAQWFANLFTGNRAPTSLENMLFIGMMLTNKAILLTHRDSQAPRLLRNAGGRPIYSSPGFSILKPEISLVSIIGISILLVIQIAGLIFCGAYIARTPTWTRVFNAMAIARIGAGLEKDKLPADGQYAEDEDYEKLRVIGLPLGMASANAIQRRPNKVADVPVRKNVRTTFYTRVPSLSANVPS